MSKIHNDIGQFLDLIYFYIIKRFNQCGFNYYRLKQMDFDGNFEYSNVISVRYEQEQKMAIYPNPVSDKLIIDTALNKEVKIRIVATNGQIIYERVKNIDNQLNIDISALNNGMYYLQLMNEESIILNEIFIKK